jgi:hypothetical protein
MDGSNNHYVIEIPENKSKISMALVQFSGLYQTQLLRENKSISLARSIPRNQSKFTTKTSTRGSFLKMLWLYNTILMF